ncbi:MAG: hypothetical protein H7Y01_12860 [Ferruginibacter sp.]|nr:hypothetical protein [Chitinophagaceae bacterium]
MSPALIIDTDNQLHEIRKQDLPQHPAVLRFAAKIISYIFHPVFVPVYVVAFLLYVHPYIFAGYTGNNKIIVIAQAFMMLTFFPLVSVLLLKALKFIDSIYLYTQKDRIIPFIACMTWYFWLWYVWNNMGKAGGADMPPETVQLALAIFITTIIGLMVNIKIKISLHAISMGVMITFMLLLGFSQTLHFGAYLSVALLITGLVCTSRFIVSDHTQLEIYAGLAVGAISMLIAYLLG